MQDKIRRKLISSTGLGAIAGFGLPKTWVKPVVESVMLPAHAQISPFSCSITGQQSVVTTNGIFNGSLDYLVTNTGSSALTNTTGGIGAVTGMVGFATGGTVIPDPLNPGSSFNFNITQVTTGACPTTGEQIRVSFQSDETSCEFIIDVSCQVMN